MTTYSNSELATRVLRDLGLIDATETPSAEDMAWAVQTIESETALLAGIGLPIWAGSEMAVPPEYLTALSRRIGLALAPSYGLMSMTDATLAMREAERYLTILAAPNGGRLMPLQANDATGGGRRFNFLTG